MKHLFAALSVVALLGAGCTGSSQKIVQFNCEQSGGTFAEGTCACPQEPAVAGAPAFTYDENRGYCIDAFGLPGGELGETAKKLQPAK